MNLRPSWGGGEEASEEKQQRRGGGVLEYLYTVYIISLIKII